jgi:tetratricopeptide (TPR) repeat protein
VPGSEHHADDAEVWVRAAEFCHHVLGDLEAAEEALHTALEISDGEEGDEEMAVQANLLLAELYLDVGDLETAQEHAQTAKTLDRDNPDAEVMLGEVLFEMGQFEDAGKAASRAIDKDQRHPGAWFLRGMVAERSADTAAAAKAFEKARTLDPDSFPEGLEMTDAELMETAKAAMADLPEEHKSFVSPLRLSVAALPPLEDIKGGHVSPTAPLALKGEALDADGGAPRPTEMVIYRNNVLRHCVSRDDLGEGLAQAVAMEVEAFLFDDDDLPTPDDALPN